MPALNCEIIQNFVLVKIAMLSDVPLKIAHQIMPNGFDVAIVAMVPVNLAQKPVKMTLCIVIVV